MQPWSDTTTKGETEGTENLCSNSHFKLGQKTVEMVISTVWLRPLDHKTFGLIKSCLRLRIACVQWCNKQSLVFSDLRHTVMSKASFSHISCNSISANLWIPSKGNG